MNSPSDANTDGRMRHHEWIPKMAAEPETASRPQRRAAEPERRASIQPVLAIVVMAIVSAVIVGAMGKAEAALSVERSVPMAGAQQMRRQAQAVQAFRDGQVAEAQGRFAKLADDGDGGSGLMALAKTGSGGMSQAQLHAH